MPTIKIAGLKSGHTSTIGTSDSALIGNYSLPTNDGVANQVLTTNGSGSVSFQDTTSISIFSFGLSTSQRDITSPVELQGSGGATFFSVSSDCTISSASVSCNATSYTSGRAIRFNIEKNGSSQQAIDINFSGTGIDSNTVSFSAISFSAGDFLSVTIVHNNTGLTTEDHGITLNLAI